MVSRQPASYQNLTTHSAGSENEPVWFTSDGVLGRVWSRSVIPHCNYKLVSMAHNLSQTTIELDQPWGNHYWEYSVSPPYYICSSSDSMMIGLRWRRGICLTGIYFLRLLTPSSSTSIESSSRWDACLLLRLLVPPYGSLLLFFGCFFFFWICSFFLRTPSASKCSWLLLPILLSSYSTSDFISGFWLFLSWVTKALPYWAAPWSSWRSPGLLTSVGCDQIGSATYAAPFSSSWAATNRTLCSGGLSGWEYSQTSNTVSR